MRAISATFVMAIMGIIAQHAFAQITHVATFENFSSNSALGSSFTDPLSGIYFHNSTNPPLPGGFVVDYSLAYFDGGNYLTAGSNSTNALGAHFGFTGDLFLPANQVSINIIYAGTPESDVHLLGLNSSGQIVDQQTGPDDLYYVASPPFTLVVTSADYNITAIRLIVGAGAVGYDNISYTVLPEPSVLSLVLAGGILAMVPRRHKAIP